MVFTVSKQIILVLTATILLTIAVAPLLTYSEPNTGASQIRAVENRILNDQAIGVSRGEPLVNPLGSNLSTLEQFLDRIIQIIINIAVPVAAFFIILSGFKFITARGNPAQIDDAKRNFWHTIIGVALLLGATVLIRAIVATVTFIRG